MLFCLQVQYSLLDRRPENGMADFCAAHGMRLLPYGVVAGGLLSDRYLGAQPSECGFSTTPDQMLHAVLIQPPCKAHVLSSMHRMNSEQFILQYSSS